jgi:perosamine synthetase
MVKLYEPCMGTAEQSAIARVIASGTLSRGPEVETFEANFSAMVGQRETVAVANGTCALHLAVRAAGWGAGDEVITSAYSFVATPNSLLYEGVRPVFAPVNADLQIDLDFVASMLKNRRIAGLLIPHIFGKKVDVEALAAIKAAHPDLIIIEDASQSIAPADYGLGVGTVGDIVTYSFHENKVMTTAGEGGAVTTNDPTMARRMRSLREHGKLQGSSWLDDIDLGYNYRMTELQAAVGDVQLSRLPEMLAKRRHLAEIYSHKINATETLFVPASTEARSWSGFYIETDDDATTRAIHASLQEHKIAYHGNPFPPLPTFNHLRKFDASGVDVSTLVERAARITMLPLHPNLPEETAITISEVINNARA